MGGSLLHGCDFRSGSASWTSAMLMSSVSREANLNEMSRGRGVVQGGETAEYTPKKSETGRQLCSDLALNSGRQLVDENAGAPPANSTIQHLCRCRSRRSVPGRSGPVVGHSLNEPEYGVLASGRRDVAWKSQQKGSLVLPSRSEIPVVASCGFTGT
ncbi:hypothetical protein VTK26DRAFT_2709 [Humicola hyalothermophila]